MRGKLVLDYHSSFHDELNVFQFVDARKRIPRDCNDIGVVARFDETYPVLPSQQVGGGGGSGADGFERG
jgi:hypothetical protein